MRGPRWQPAAAEAVDGGAMAATGVGRRRALSLSSRWRERESIYDHTLKCAGTCTKGLFSF